MAEPSDTSPSMAEAQIRLLREAGTERRLAIALSLSSTVIRLSREAIRKAHPDWSELEVKLAWVGLHYGPDLEARVRRYLQQRGQL